MIKPKTISLKENILRGKKLFSEYDPILGIGSLIPRFKYKLFKDQKKQLFIPEEMKSISFVKDSIKYKSLEEYCDKTKQDFKELLDVFTNLREMYDFEYWAYTSVKIKPKGDQGMAPFKLRQTQRKLLFELEKLRLAGVPIRIILLKARQWGGSTLIQIYMSWIQLKHKTHWNSLVVGAVENQARVVRGMYTRLIHNYPTKITEKPYEGSPKSRIINERECILSIGSMEKPEGIRSEDISMAHLTEVGSWKKTEGKTPEDLIQTIQGTIPSIPYSFYALESTAKGTGNFFHRSWTHAVNGTSNLTPVFIAWFEIEEYFKEFKNEKERIDFIPTMSEYELWLWEIGASLEGINWYRDKLSSMEGNTWSMRSEFPSTPDEAFQSTGRRAFAPNYVNNLKHTIKEPEFIGDIFPNNLNGKEALENIEFNEYNKGDLKIWKKPNDPPVPEGKKMVNRYGLFVDIGGRSKGADYSVISVFDRYWMADGGLPERVATWRGHIDQDLLAWKAAQIGMYYEKGLLAFESNSLRTNEDTEGIHHITMLDEISDHYDNLYSRSNPEQVREGLPNLWGFHTNKATKTMIIDHYNGLLRVVGYVEHDQMAVNEANWYEIKTNGSYGAIDGQHDDVLMTTMGGTWMVISYMDKPYLVDLIPISSTSRVLKSAANF